VARERLVTRLGLTQDVRVGRGLNP
jgi:hypothetical protein